MRHKTVKTMLVLLLAIWVAGLALGQQPATKPLAIDDLMLLDAPQSVVVAPDLKRAAVIRRWIDRPTLQERFSFWLVEETADHARAAETEEPDARSAVFSPDGRWIALRSTRHRPEGWQQTPSVPPESDAPTDIWLFSVADGVCLPLAGAEKPYGRVFNDPFYGRVAFSPDSKQLTFIADDGRDPRSAEELAADVYLVRPDQGEGYTGYGAAQVWVADLDAAPQDHAASRIRRLTNDGVWYGDPQWMPDGRALVCHANKTPHVESVRFSVNKNFDLWAIDVETGRQRQLTLGSGPEVSPRISSDGTRLICLSSPRQGPHADIFNLLLVPLSGKETAPVAQVLFDHHATAAGPLPHGSPPHSVPAFPLPVDCWESRSTVVYTSFKGTTSETVRVDLETGQGTTFDIKAEGNSPDGLATQVASRLAARQRLAPPGNQFLRDRSVAEERVVQWTNQGLKLDGVITLPPAEVAKPPYPLVVYPHGGPHSRSTRGFNFTVQVLAAHGYLVFQPNFRGSSGYGRAFLDADRIDLGGEDMRDILVGIEKLVEQKLADRNRQFVYGISYGGFMTCWLVGHTNQFRAAVAQNAVTDMNVMWGLSDLQSWTEWELGGRPWEAPEAMRRHSPISYVNEIRTPTLVLHSREDRRCPIAMGRMFHQSLLSRGVPTQMVVYPGEGHGIRQPKHQMDVLQRTLAWFAAHDVGAEAEIVMLGDSITKGVRPGVKPEETFAAITEGRLRELGWKLRVTNAGIGGERTDQALQRIQREVLARKPRIVTIMYGTNDSYVDPGKDSSRLSPQAYRANLCELVEKVRAAGAIPVLMTAPRWGAQARPIGLKEHPNERLEVYLDACRDVARELQVPLVDHYTHWLAAERQGQDLGGWTTDECHPNPRGHRELADLMLPVLRVVQLRAAMAGQTSSPVQVPATP